MVKKVRYFRQSLGSGAKFHVTVGHTTVMATVTFFGVKEIAQQLKKSVDSNVGPRTVDEKEPPSSHSSSNEDKNVAKELVTSSLGGNADIAGLPSLTFNFDEDFLQQDGYTEKLDVEDHGGQDEDMPLHWAIIDFQTPVYCPLNSLVIGSRLDTDIQANTCRLAFSGRLVQKFDTTSEMDKIKFYSKKERSGSICRLGDPYKRGDDGKIVRYEVFGSELFKKETNMTQFIGLHLETARGDVGVIQSSFGTSGKFKMFFPAGTDARNGDKLFLRFKRYANDPEKKIRQHSSLPKERVGAKIETESKKEKKNKKSNKAINGSSDCRQNMIGNITNTKGDALQDGLYTTVIVEGFFTPQDNIRGKVGTKVVVVGSTMEGSVQGSFGKAGKCKVGFKNGISKDLVGAKVELINDK